MRWSFEDSMPKTYLFAVVLFSLVMAAYAAFESVQEKHHYAALQQQESAPQDIEAASADSTTARAQLKASRGQGSAD